MILKRECQRDLDLFENELENWTRSTWLSGDELVAVIAGCIFVAVMVALIAWGDGCAVMGAGAVSPLHAAVRRACEDAHATRQRRILEDIADHHRREIVARFVTLVLALLVIAGAVAAVMGRGC